MNGQIEEKDRAIGQARAQVESIREMVKAYNEAIEADDDDARDEAEQAIHEDPLSVQVRSGWYTPGDKYAGPEEYEILLCTGGPAVRIVGDLNQYSEPENAKVEYQDWFTPWAHYPTNSDEDEDLLTYAQAFYFGD